MTHKFKVGDKIIMTKAYSCYFEAGDIGVLSKSDWDNSNDYWAKFPKHDHLCCLGSGDENHYNLFKLFAETIVEPGNFTLAEEFDIPVMKPLHITYCGVTITLDAQMQSSRQFAEKLLDLAYGKETNV